MENSTSLVGELSSFLVDSVGGYGGRVLSGRKQPGASLIHFDISGKCSAYGVLLDDIQSSIGCGLKNADCVVPPVG